MSVIDHQACAVFFAQGNNFRQWSQITAHAEQAIHYNELTFIVRDAGQNALEISHIIMAKTTRLAPSQAGAIYDTGMVIFIENDNVAAHDQGADRAKISLHAGGEDEGSLL